MPNLPFDFNVQQNFPIAAGIQAAQENANRQQQAQQFGQQSLVQGLQAIGQVGQSLLDRKMAMAQAMAGAKLYANQNPDLFNPTTTTTQTPVRRDQTASYDPSTGKATPNTGMPGVGTERAQTTTTAPPLDLQTAAMAFMGDKPSDVMKQMFEQHKLKVESGLEAQRIANEAQIKNVLAGFTGQEVGIKGQEAGTQAAKASTEDRNALLARKAELTKLLPGTFGTYWGNDAAQSARAEIAQIDAKLAEQGSGGNATTNPGGVPKFQTKNGTSYTVNP